MDETDPHSADDYRTYVEHPRFGRGPVLTGVNPGRHNVHLHWRTAHSLLISGTAVAADLEKQTPATVPVTHYFDERRTCRDCGRRFIFFAEEQKYWYEELGFGLDADCVRCYPCRRSSQHLDRLHERYRELLALGASSPQMCVEIAAVAINLMTAGGFAVHQRTLDRVRMWLNRARGMPQLEARREELCEQVRALDASFREQNSGD